MEKQKQKQKNPEKYTNNININQEIGSIGWVLYDFSKNPVWDSYKSHSWQISVWD